MIPEDVMKNPVKGWLGVDPGRSSGALALIKPVSEQSEIRHVFTWPVCDMTDRDIWDLVKLVTPLVSCATLELVHAMPKQGVSSTFKFGASFGELKMALVASGIPFQTVTPQKWQKALSCSSGGDLNVLKTKAQELYPKAPRITHKTSAAILIAEYTRRHWL